MKPKISLDFDSTLDRGDVQSFVRKLSLRGFDLWITTSRIDTNTALKNGWWWVKSNNQELYDVAESCGIPVENIVFTSYIDKIEVLKDKNFIFHLDDDEVEVDLINQSDDRCVGVWVENPNWEKICLKIIDALTH
jgi:hypothetical protein